MGHQQLVDDRVGEVAQKRGDQQHCGGQSPEDAFAESGQGAEGVGGDSRAAAVQIDLSERGNGEVDAAEHCDQSREFGEPVEKHQNPSLSGCGKLLKPCYITLQ